MEKTPVGLREHWGTRLGFILASLGSAIGLGTLWKFPYVTAENGGGLFVLLYLFFTLFFGIPLFTGELLLGRKAGRAAVGVFAAFSGEESPWKAVGWLAVLSSFLILSYYCVVAGWGLNYLLLSLNQFYETHTPEQIAKTFEILDNSGDISLFWAAIFLILTLGVVYQGVRKGIEFWNKILMILLFCLLIALCLYAMTLDGFLAAVSFLFHPQFKLAGILEALGLSLFTLSLAQGIILTYGSYARPNDDLPKIAFIVGISVVLISSITVLTIFPVIFTFHLSPDEGGAGLVFKTLPVLFASLPGAMILSTLFFTLFTFTALTSSVALLEVVVANLMDLYHWSRKKALLWSTLAVFIVAIPSALAGSRSLFKEWQPMYGHSFFSSIDSLVSVWFLPIGGFFTSIYLGWHLKKENVKDEFVKGSSFLKLFPFWYFLIRWIAPIAIFFIFLQQGGFLGQKSG